MGIAYQPRVQTLGIHPEKETRVLKERRIVCVSWTSTPPFLCGVPSEHTYSLGCNSQGLHPGLVCVAPLGQMGRWRFRFRVLRDVAWGPSVQTGASVPGYSGGFAAYVVVL